MIKVSHQSPAQFLNMSRYYNDYDYALVHMFEQDSSYYKFFRDSVLLGRQVLLDNSIFELGVSFDNDKFALWVKTLNPTYYIIPDVLDDADATVNRLQGWCSTYSHLPGKRIGVLQGQNVGQLLSCYDDIINYVDKIAISFNSAPFASDNKVEQALNRIKFVNKLCTTRIVTKPIHLLGVSVPQQVVAYKNNPFIESVDTSNPIVHGCHNIRYYNSGLDRKISTKLVDIYDGEFNCDQINDVYYNVSMFKKFLGR